jgi:hypothetical protein
VGHPARKIAHEIRACPEFRRGLAKPPLSSNFPQKHFDPQLAGPDVAVQLVSKICASCFGGKLPATDDAAFVAAMMAAFMPTILFGQPQAVLDCFAAGLSQAVGALRESEDSRWEN